VEIAYLISIAVIIPSYRRALLLQQVLGALCYQSYSNFDVLVVLKPSNDGSEEVTKRFSSFLNIHVVKQKLGGFLDALNLAFASVKNSDVLFFLDDDTIPFSDLIQRHINHYTDSKVGGVAGDLINPENGKTFNPYLDKSPIELKWNYLKPIKGQECFFYYLSRSGFVLCQPLRSNESLLGSGANFSVRRGAIQGFRFNSDKWESGMNNEQVLGWYLWKHGWKLLFDPSAKAYHIQHESLSRQGFNQSVIESAKLFWRLKPLEPELSFLCRLQYFIITNLIRCRQSLVEGKLPLDVLQKLRWLA
jgi:GT2 family glycosyltransferase